MRDAIRSLFSRGGAAGAEDDSGLRIAACALMLEIAHADDEFTAEERENIERALGDHFRLDPEHVRELIELAEQQRRESADLFQFTAVINEKYDEAKRLEVAELLWRVVFADGRLSHHETHLMRKIANLLALTPHMVADARKRAEDASRA